MVPEVGLEPTHSKEYWILSPARLPIPPLRHRRSYPNRLAKGITSAGILATKRQKVKADMRQEKSLTHQVILLYLPLDKSGGAIAQLGERMTGSHEVRGSIPLGSTNIYCSFWIFGSPMIHFFGALLGPLYHFLFGTRLNRDSKVPFPNPQISLSFYQTRETPFRSNQEIFKTNPKSDDNLISVPVRFPKGPT